MQQPLLYKRDIVGVILLYSQWQRTVSFGTPVQLNFVFNCFPLALVNSVMCVIGPIVQFLRSSCPQFFYIPTSYDPSPIFANDLGFYMLLSYATILVHASPFIFCFVTISLFLSQVGAIRMVSVTQKTVLEVVVVFRGQNEDTQTREVG